MQDSIFQKFLVEGDIHGLLEESNHGADLSPEQLKDLKAFTTELSKLEMQRKGAELAKDPNYRKVVIDKAVQDLMVNMSQTFATTAEKKKKQEKEEKTSEEAETKPVKKSKKKE